MNLFDLATWHAEELVKARARGNLALQMRDTASFKIYAGQQLFHVEAIRLCNGELNAPFPVESNHV
jgi:hypothetical protein